MVYSAGHPIDVAREVAATDPAMMLEATTGRPRRLSPQTSRSPWDTILQLTQTPPPAWTAAGAAATGDAPEQMQLLTVELVTMHTSDMHRTSIDDITHTRLRAPRSLADPASLTHAHITAACARTQSAVAAVADLAGNLARAAGADPTTARGHRDRTRDQATAALAGPFQQWSANPRPDGHNVGTWCARAAADLLPLVDDLMRACPPRAWAGHAITATDGGGRHLTAAAAENFTRAQLRRALTDAA